MIMTSTSRGMPQEKFHVQQLLNHFHTKAFDAIHTVTQSSVQHSSPVQDISMHTEPSKHNSGPTTLHRCLFLKWSLLSLFLGLIMVASIPVSAPGTGINTVSFDQQGLSGRLKDFPLREILLELSSRAGFELQTIGRLDQTVSVEFKNKPLIQGIRDLMRLTGLSYVIIQSTAGDTNTQGLSNPVQTLLVLDNSDTSPRSRSRHRTSGITREEDASAAQAYQQEEPAEPYESNTVETSVQTEVEFEGSKQDLEEFVESLSQEKKINKEEYDMIMEKIN